MSLTAVLIVVAIVALVAWLCANYIPQPTGRSVAALIVVLLGLWLLARWVASGAPGLPR